MIPFVRKQNFATRKDLNFSSPTIFLSRNSILQKKKKKYRQLLCTKIQSQKPIRIPSSKINFVSRCIHFTNKKSKKKKKKKSTQSPIYCITKISSRSISKTNKIHGRKLESIPRGAHERIYLLSLDAPCDVITAIK